MSTTIRIAVALELLLVCGEGACQSLGNYLPLGGSHIAQVGLSLGVAVAATELWSAWNDLRAK